MASEHWTRIARLLDQKKDVSLELNVSNTFYDDDPMPVSYTHLAAGGEGKPGAAQEEKPPAGKEGSDKEKPAAKE